MNLARVALLLANINNVLFTVYVYDLGKLTESFTTLTLLVTIVYLGLAIAASMQ